MKKQQILLALFVAFFTLTMGVARAQKAPKAHVGTKTSKVTKSPKKSKKKNPVKPNPTTPSANSIAPFNVESKTGTVKAISGSDVSFTVKAVGADKPTYEWQVDTTCSGSGAFVKLTEGKATFGGTYKNVATDKLVVLGVACKMDKFRFRCIVSVAGDKKIITSITSDTAFLFVVGCISPVNDTVRVSGSDKNPSHTTLSIPKDDLIAHYQWQRQDLLSGNWDSISDQDLHTGSQTNSLTIAVKDGALHQVKYRCLLTSNGTKKETTASDVHRIVVANWLFHDGIPVSANSTTSFSVIEPGSHLRYTWKVKEYFRRKRHKGHSINDNSVQEADKGFREIKTSGADSLYYSLSSGAGSILTVTVNPGMNRNEYRLQVYDSITGTYFNTAPATLFEVGPVDALPLELSAAIYTQPKGLSDDNSQALTQTYIRCSIPLGEHAKSGVEVNDKFLDRLMYFRNLFIQLTYSTNAGNLNYVNDSSKKAIGVTDPNKRYVNLLDIYQYANLNLNIMSPIVTWIGGSARRENMCNVYLDPYVQFLHTTVADSPASNISLMSMTYGLNLTFRFKASKRFTLEMNQRVFGMNVLSGGVNQKGNYQFARRADYDITGTGKPLTIGNQPYFNFDGLVMYNTSSAADNSSNIFIHFSTISNMAGEKDKAAKNTFFQLQVGVATDLEKLAQNLYKTLTKG